MKRERICLIIACLLSFALTTGIMEWRMEVVHAEIAQTQKTLAEEVFRFHVIAESNSVKDQRIKLHVRDTVLSYMKSQMPETERKSAQLTKDWVKKHQKELVKTADEVLKKEGVSYRAQAKVTSCYFPDKRYGDIIFPEGEYEALRITLGSGKGHNWWCVLYPSLCFTNATCAVVDEDGKKELKEALSAEEYEMVTAASEFKIKWFFFGNSDKTRRITLPGIVNYFQDCSTFQSEDLGLGIMHCSERKRAWILSSWQVVVERYPEIGEKIQTSTWATDFKGLFGERNFCMTDENGNDVAYANSLWVYMDIERGRPARPDESEIAPYGTGEPYEMTYESRKIPLPTESEELESFPVRRYHIDTNEHVNNCQYVQMALESLPKDKEVHQMRVEYKKSAVYGDMIYPRIAAEDDRTVVELCDENAKPYAVIEFRFA